MKKSFLSQNFAAVYNYGLLITRNGQTVIAGSQKLPTRSESAYGYIPYPGNDSDNNPMPADFEKVQDSDVVAIITNVTYKI